MYYPNPGKKLEIEIDGKKFLRIPIKTKVINSKDNIISIIKEFALPHYQKGDIIFISEKVVAITQGRAIKIKDIKPSYLAKFLSKFVYKNPFGIGIAMPETMELAIKEAGLIRILFAAFCAAITKPFGIKGIFYYIAGRSVAGIDGPVPYALPPYNQYAVLAPKNPQKIVNEISKNLKIKCAIIDANDLGVEVLAANNGIDKKLLKSVLKDNPLGQSSEQTPIGILRQINPTSDIRTSDVNGKSA